MAAPADDLPDAVRRLGGMKTGFSGGPWRAGSVEAMLALLSLCCVIIKQQRASESKKQDQNKFQD